MDNLSVNFKYSSTSGGYTIEKVISRGGIEENSTILLPQQVADDFVEFYNLTK